MSTEYRVVYDRYGGFEVQSRKRWFSFWVQGRPNTHSTIEKARAYAEECAKCAKHAKCDQVVVEYLGRLDT